METEVKLSFFKRIKMSMFDFDKYHIIASEGLGRGMLYLVKLMLVFTLILACSFLAKFSLIIDECTNYINEKTPNFYIQDNKLYIESEEDVVLENHQYLNIEVIFSSKEDYNENDIMNFDGINIVLLKDKVLFKQQDSTSIITKTYEEINNIYNINNISKETIISYFEGSNKNNILINIFAILFITIFLVYFLTVILDTVALSLFGYIVSRIIRVPLKYNAIYNISISAITLPIILNLIYIIANLFTGFVITYFQIMYTLVSYICLVAALLIMKSEITKKKIQIKMAIMNKQNSEEEEKTEDSPKEEEKKEENKEEKKEDLKDKVNGKINKDKPEPQANIKEQ